MKKKINKHGWINTPAPADSYRSIFKWGSAEKFKHPNNYLTELLKDFFSLKEEYFEKPLNTGFETVSYTIPVKLEKKHIIFFQNTCGAENVKIDEYSRLKYAYGKTMYDLIRLRNKTIENLPDAVLHPKTKEEIIKIVNYCNKNKIAIYVTGGRTSVTRGTEPVKKGISLDMSTHFNNVISFSEINQTITVEAGIMGAKLENILNNADEKIGAKRKYTCGHFPQSFEFSTAGGWTVTHGSGQQSTYYGDIKDLVIAQEYITPSGVIKTKSFPAEASGPSINSIMIGNEGAFGILVNVTLKVFRYYPKNRRYFSFLFKNFKEALNAVREINQSEAGVPSALRLSDAEETNIAFKLYGIDDSFMAKILPILGYKKNKRCLLLGFCDGGKNYTALVKKNIKKISKTNKSINITGYPAKKWEKNRFKDPYMRDDFQDFGIITDTLETSVTWENILEVYNAVRAFCKSRPETIVMIHLSHFYVSGTNLYIIFTGRFNSIKDFTAFQKGIIDTIISHGGSLSHHHGIGKLLAPWFENYLGKNELGIIKSIKTYLDPKNIMNPGGTLGLDKINKSKNYTK
ncbi:MAG: FAD-binding oxidoreductase [Spirochaetia bacterium]|nr:FAD-binding oxidoreductase [Spirochaetia bacterium]